MKYKSDRIAYTKHFDTMLGDNLACRCCGFAKITPAVTIHHLMLEEFHEWFGRAMPKISGTRCVFWNKHEGGADDSRHLYGDASDIAFTADFYKETIKRKREFLINIRNKWEELCNKYGVRGGVGFYNNWFHLDSRPFNPKKPKMAKWDNSDYF